MSEVKGYKVAMPGDDHPGKLRVLKKYVNRFGKARLHGSSVGSQPEFAGSIAIRVINNLIERGIIQANDMLDD